MDDVKIYYGDQSQVNPLGRRNYDEYLTYTEKKQELPGFDREYLDIVDYIIKITHRIWEEKGVGIIYDTYANNCVVHTGDGASVGSQNVVSNTLSMLHAFPGRLEHPLPGLFLDLYLSIWIQHPGDGRLRHARSPGHVGGCHAAVPVPSFCHNPSPSSFRIYGLFGFYCIRTGLSCPFFP